MVAVSGCVGPHTQWERLGHQSAQVWRDMRNGSMVAMPNARAHTHTNTHTHARTHTYTHTHTHTHKTYSPRQMNLKAAAGKDAGSSKAHHLLEMKTRIEGLGLLMPRQRLRQLALQADWPRWYVCCNHHQKQ